MVSSLVVDGLSYKLRPTMKSFNFYWTLQRARGNWKSKMGRRKWKVKGWKL